MVIVKLDVVVEAGLTAAEKEWYWLPDLVNSASARALLTMFYCGVEVMIGKLLDEVGEIVPN